MGGEVNPEHALPIVPHWIGLMCCLQSWSRLGCVRVGVQCQSVGVPHAVHSVCWPPMLCAEHVASQPMPSPGLAHIACRPGIGYMWFMGWTWCCTWHRVSECELHGPTPVLSVLLSPAHALWAVNAPNQLSMLHTQQPLQLVHAACSAQAGPSTVGTAQGVTLSPASRLAQQTSSSLWGFMSLILFF